LIIKWSYIIICFIFLLVNLYLIKIIYIIYYC
jgi:hypothetical protein